VGTGPGIDAIGAKTILDPKVTVMTDVHPNVVPLAAENFRRFHPDAKHTALLGNLCEPLRQQGILADVIYANLPNIPADDEQEILQGTHSATFIPSSSLKHVPEQYNKYLLGNL